MLVDDRKVDRPTVEDCQPMWGTKKIADYVLLRQPSHDGYPFFHRRQTPLPTPLTSAIVSGQAMLMGFIRSVHATTSSTIPAPTVSPPRRSKMRPISLLFVNVSSDTFCCRSVEPSAGARIVICTVADVLRGSTLCEEHDKGAKDKLSVNEEAKARGGGRLTSDCS